MLKTTRTTAATTPLSIQAEQSSSELPATDSVGSVEPQLELFHISPPSELKRWAVPAAFPELQTPSQEPSSGASLPQNRAFSILEENSAASSSSNMRAQLAQAPNGARGKNSRTGSLKAPEKRAYERSLRASGLERRQGIAAELEVENHLIRRGWFPLARNHTSPYGEVDLIMLDESVVVYIEVKSRGEGALVDAFESISHTKKGKVVRAAIDYAKRAGLHDKPMRFDVVGLVKRRGGKRSLRHIEGAFDTSVLKSPRY